MRHWEGLLFVTLALVTATSAAQGVAPLPPRQACVSPPVDLVAWWPFDAAERSSTEELASASSARLVGKLAVVAGKVGSAMSFAAAGSRLEVADHDDLDFGTSDFSFDFWLRTSDTSPLATIIDKRTMTPAVRGYSLWVAAGKLGVQLADGRGPSSRCSSDPQRSACTNYGSEVFVADGKWHFVAVTIDRDDPRGGRIYLDGRRASTFDPTQRRGSLSNAATLLIGASAGTAGGTYRGLLDEVELFRRGLTESEIRSIYRAGPDGKCKPRVLSVPGSPVRIALTGTTSYRVSLDGRTFSRPLPQKLRLELRYKPFEPLAEKAPNVAPPLRQDDAEVVIVQFVTPPLDAYRRAIETLGGKTYTFLPDQALLVRLPPRARSAVQAQPFVRWIGPYHPAYKLEEVLRERLVSGPKAGPTRYNIQLLERGAFAAPVAERITALGGKIDNVVPQGFRIEATLDDAQLLAVARLWQVLFIDRWGPPEPDMDIVRQIGGANQLLSVAGYSGQGVRGEALDSGLLTTHADFAASPPLLHGSNSPNTSHGTSVYGIVFGTGASDGTARGLLPDGQGIFSSYAGLTNRYTHTAELINASMPFRASFQTNSWGTTLTTAYTTESSQFDDILFLNDLLVTQSQSNAGTKNSRPQAWAKNVVSIGGIKHLDTLSTSDDKWTNGASIGPATDGRLKPDLSNFYDFTFTTASGSNTSHTPTFGGTSGATPITAGHFGLLFQMWADGVFSGFPGKNLDVFNARPRATTAKALMINTAWQYAFTGSGHDLTRVHQGWGRADIANLYDLARTNGWKLPLVIDQSSTLAPFGVDTYSVNVPGDAADTLWFKATLVYPDPAGNPAASKHRVNDLTLRVTAPDGTVYWGNNGLSAAVWSTAGGVPNDLDTVENVFLSDGPPGQYKIEVLANAIVQDGYLATSQLDAVYSLVVTRALGSCKAPPAGMVGWWSFDGALANPPTITPLAGPVPDIQGALNGQPVGAIYRVDGEVRQGALFTDNSWIAVPDDPALDFGVASAGDFSIDAWYNTSGEALGSDEWDQRVVAQKLEGDPSLGPAHGYSLSLVEGTTTASFELTLADGTATVFPSQIDDTLGGWHHIAVTVDRDSPTGGHWYLDGVEISSSQFDPTPRSGSLTNAAPLKMGKLDKSGPWALDEVEIFKRALTGPEVKDIYDAGIQGKCKLDVWVEDTPYNDTSAAPDTGEEPDANMVGKPIYASRAMWVRNDGSPCAGTTHLDHTNPKFGPTNTVCVQVKNRSARPASATTVEVYFAPASSGLPWPNSVWTLIGSKVISLPASGQQVVEIPWANVPDPQGEPDGHFCLVTRLVSTEDPMTYPEGTNIGANVVNNNNIAWRNVNILGFLVKTNETMDVRVRNVRREKAPVDLTFRGREGFVADGGAIVVDLGPLFALWRAAGGKGRNVEVIDRTKVKLRALPATIDGIPMAGGEERVLELTAQSLEPVARDGKSYRYTVDVVESIGGVEIGGVSYSITTRARGTDTDGDGIADIGDPDDDNDGIPDATDPNPVGGGGPAGCLPGGRTTVLRGIHYRIQEFPTCAVATAHAESPVSLATPRYKAACEGAAVVGARVILCAVSPPLSRGWVVVDVEVCCK